MNVGSVFSLVCFLYWHSDSELVPMISHATNSKGTIHTSSELFNDVMLYVCLAETDEFTSGPKTKHILCFK